MARTIIPLSSPNKLISQVNRLYSLVLHSWNGELSFVGDLTEDGGAESSGLAAAAPWSAGKGDALTLSCHRAGCKGNFFPLKFRNNLFSE